MAQAHAHLGYAPRGVGLQYAVLWFADADDVLGWYVGDHDGEHQAAYFALQDYYTVGRAHFLRSVQDDVYGPWVESTPGGDAPLPHPPPIAEALCHELVRLQDQFIRHWLFFGDDPAHGDDAGALQARELAVRGVNIQPTRLGKFTRAAAVWRYDAPGADTNVLVALSKRWPLDCRIDD